MTVSKDIHIPNDPSAEGKNKLSTDVIAGAAQHNVEQEKREAHDDAKIQRRRDGSQLEPLFEGNVDGEFRNRWREIQAGFVDEPRNAVERADELVAELMQKLAQSFSQQRNNLEHQWDASENVSTEDLRVALTRYRSFFERLLSV